jgi:uncharacterized membrane protein
MTDIAPPKKRIEFIDLLRGWAVIVMIETHVFNATLLPELTGTPFFQALKFINGLVAPAFLFASGMAYAVTTRRKLNDYLSFGRPLFRQLARLLFIMLIGYSLHIPKFNYEHLRYDAGPTAWEMFWQADVLQCIAVSLLFLQVALLVTRSERRLYRLIIGITAGIVFATPLMWGIDFRGLLPAPISAYLNGRQYSLFPLFPWSAFVFGGAIAGSYYLRAKDRMNVAGTTDPVGGMMARAVAVALGIIAVSFALHPVAAMAYPSYDYWRVSPSFFMLRLGIVMILCAGMFLYERRKGVSPGSFVALMGRESLLVYATHLLLVYGKFGAWTFTDRVGSSFGYAEAAVTTIVLLGLMYVLAYGWSRVKAGPAGVKRAVQGVILAGFVLVFFFGPR